MNWVFLWIWSKEFRPRELRDDEFVDVVWDFDVIILKLSSLRVNIKNMQSSGKIITLNADSRDTIASLKRKIQQECRAWSFSQWDYPYRFRLSFKGKRLQDSTTLRGNSRRGVARAKDHIPISSCHMPF